MRGILTTAFVAGGCILLSLGLAACQGGAHAAQHNLRTNPSAAASTAPPTTTTTTVPPTTTTTVPPTTTTTAPPGPVFSMSGQGTEATATFTVASSWTLAWNYDCSDSGGQGNFIVSPYSAISNSTPVGDLPVNELGPGGSGVQNYYDGGGTMYLEINSECSWSIQVNSTTPASPTTPTTAPAQELFSTSGQGTQTTSAFMVPSSWTLAWNYDCSNAGGRGNFIVTPYSQTTSAPIPGDLGVNELGPSGSGVQHFYVGGATVYLEINSECSWSVQVNG
jgi:hypothetical protein